jgi:hypothetical protein
MSNSDKELPFSIDLIKNLDKQYPPVRPNDSISDRELWGRIYQRRLVDSLLVKYNLKEFNVSIE